MLRVMYGAVVIKVGMLCAFRIAAKGMYAKVCHMANGEGVNARRNAAAMPMEGVTYGIWQKRERGVQARWRERATCSMQPRPAPPRARFHAPAPWRPPPAPGKADVLFSARAGRREGGEARMRNLPHESSAEGVSLPFVPRGAVHVYYARVCPTPSPTAGPSNWDGLKEVFSCSILSVVNVPKPTNHA